MPLGRLKALLERGASAGGVLGARVHTRDQTQRLADTEDRTWSDPVQSPGWQVHLPRAVVQDGLKRLGPEVPWCHYFDLGDGLWTVTPDQGRYWGKAKGLKIIGQQVLAAVPYITRKADVAALRVLDLASAEGAHAVEFGQAGAREVLGIEGRQLYVDRARFIAECFGLGNVRFELGDVRAISPAAIGTFDLVLFFGILHHLSPDDFFPMLQRLRTVTADTLILYTHTSERRASEKFRLSEEKQIAGGFSGALYREHPDDATREQRERRIRNSLDNTFSFWAREASLLDGLKRAGFSYITKMLHPNPFGDPTGEFRVLYVCRVAGV
jgi:SAM-dependent methyltransferase